MAAIITNDQRLALIQQRRFQLLVQAAIWNFSTILHNSDGTPLPPGLTREEWAMQRFLIAENILAKPAGQDPISWAFIAGVFLENAVIWTVGVPPQTDFDATIDFMISIGKFDELAKQIIAFLSEHVTFGTMV